MQATPAIIVMSVKMTLIFFGAYSYLIRVSSKSIIL